MFCSDLELEIWNILFDILIDEERYDEIKIRFNGFELNESYIIGNRSQGEILKYLYCTEKDIMRDFTLSITINETVYDNFNPFWIYLFIAKNARAMIIRKGSTKALDTLDEVAEYLLSKLNLTYNNIEDMDPNYFGGKKIRTILYNEISQCYVGYLSTGNAEKALQQYPKDVCHYELLGLYNKAIGLAHHENRKSREKALKYYDSVIKYFEDSRSGIDGYNYEFNKDLWDIYIYIPALLQKADLLIKLQRSEESISVIDQLEKYYKQYTKQLKINNIIVDMKYKICTAQILKGYAKIEASKYDFSEIKDYENLLPDLKIFLKRKIFRNKYSLLRAKFFIQRSIDREIKDEKEDKKIFESLSICKNIYQESKINEEDGEQVLAALYWLESIQARMKINSKIGSKKLRNDEELNFLIDIVEMVTDCLNQSGKLSYKCWIPVSDKVIKALLDIFENAETGSENANDKFNNSYMQLIKVLLKNNSFKSSNYDKVKFCRKARLLKNEKPEDKYIDLDFPLEKEIETVRKFVRKNIHADFYLKQLRFNTESFDEKLIYNSYWPQYRNKYAFTVLRKWQSYTPSLGSYSTTSRGGGYFLYKVGEKGFIEEGIIIDPGYDFIENFFDHGFSVMDINTIAFTHSHIDHSIDFRGLITLIREMNNRASKQKHGWKPRKVRIVATPSCFELFYSTLNDCRDYIEDVIITDPEISKRSNVIQLAKHFTITAVPAYHKEIQEDANCIGLIVSTTENRQLIGFTGDTVWTRTLYRNLEGCSVVCINMGALLDIRKGHCFEKNYKNKDEIKRLIYEQNHLYLPGTIIVLEELLNSDFNGVAIVGELGEELKSGLREDLYHKFNELVNSYSKGTNFKVAMEDIGLTITWNKQHIPQFRCSRCKKPVVYEDLILKVVKDIRGAEQLNYYCIDCASILEALETGVEENWRRRYL